MLHRPQSFQGFLTESKARDEFRMLELGIIDKIPIIVWRLYDRNWVSDSKDAIGDLIYLHQWPDTDIDQRYDYKIYATSFPWPEETKIQIEEWRSGEIHQLEMIEYIWAHFNKIAAVYTQDWLDFKYFYCVNTGWWFSPQGKRLRLPRIPAEKLPRFLNQ